MDDVRSLAVTVPLPLEENKSQNKIGVIALLLVDGYYVRATAGSSVLVVVFHFDLIANNKFLDTRLSEIHAGLGLWKFH